MSFKCKPEILLARRIPPLDDAVSTLQLLNSRLFVTSLPQLVARMIKPKERRNRLTAGGIIIGGPINGCLVL